MENRRAVMISVIAAVCAIGAFWMYVNKAVDRRIGRLKERVTVLRASRDIPPNTRIDESMVSIDASWPAEYLPPKSAQSLGEVIGQVSLATILQGEPVLTTKLVPFDESSIDRRIPEGYRAVTIGIRDDQDVVGVGGMLRPGQFVDVLLTLFMNTKEIEKGQQLVSENIPLKAEVRTIFQNVKILAVGRDARIQTANVNRPTPIEEELTNKNITVALKPEDVQRMVLSQQVGRITISLRRFNDPDMVALDYLDPFRAFGIKLPITSGPPPAYREIRGGQVFATPF